MIHACRKRTPFRFKLSLSLRVLTSRGVRIIVGIWARALSTGRAVWARMHTLARFPSPSLRRLCSKWVPGIQPGDECVEERDWPPYLEIQWLRMGIFEQGAPLRSVKAWDLVLTCSLKASINIKRLRRTATRGVMRLKQERTGEIETDISH